MCTMAHVLATRVWSDICSRSSQINEIEGLRKVQNNPQLWQNFIPVYDRLLKFASNFLAAPWIHQTSIDE